jgi:tetratricopeptide (TPR) repeat protein
MLSHNYEKACPLLEKAVVLDPGNGKAHNNLGWCYRALRRLEDAVRELELALTNGYTHEGVHYNLGVTLLNLGRCQEGMDHFIEALRINPLYRPVLRDLAKIGTLFGGMSNPTTIEDAKRIKAVLNTLGNPKII